MNKKDKLNSALDNIIGVKEQPKNKNKKGSFTNEIVKKVDEKLLMEDGRQLLT